MLAMGMLSNEAVEGGYCGSNLGIECSGVIVALGEGATDLKVGQRFHPHMFSRFQLVLLTRAQPTFIASFCTCRVVCVARHCFSTYITTLAPLVQPIPDWMTFEEAATIPATFLTALYALKVRFLALLSVIMKN